MLSSISVCCPPPSHSIGPLVRLTPKTDKTTLSYAAIFGIREDLNLHGTQYNWLSSK